MISVGNFDNNTFRQLTIDYFRLSKGFELHLLDGKITNVVAQGFGITKGMKEIIVETKDPGLSEFYILNEALNSSTSILNSWYNVQEFYIIFRQRISQKIKDEFSNRIIGKNAVIKILDLEDFQNEVNKISELLPKYNNLFNSWGDAYFNVAANLFNFFVQHKNNWAQHFYKAIEESKFLKDNSRRFFQYDPEENQFGLDPIQIFASFNYSGINQHKRIENLNNLLAALGSSKILNVQIDFQGIPSPIIRSIINNRKIEVQNEIWQFFARIFKDRLNGLTSDDFENLKKWKGISIPSLTMFLFWIDPIEFIPLDVNTVNYLKTTGIISSRPKNFKDYRDLCLKKNTLQEAKFTDINNVFRFIVKEAYSTFESKDIKVNISGSTETLIVKQTGIKENIDQIETRLLKSRKEQYKNFKIIAVRPKKPFDLDHTSRWNKHIKNLNPGTTYCLYQAYKFKSAEDNEIEYEQDLDLDIYNENDLNISISAIVGMNGSGKSAIADLIYLVINKVALAKGISTSESLIDEEVYADLYIKADKLYKISVGKEIETFIYEVNDSNTKYIKSTIESEAEITFQKLDIESLCYTLVLNYSLYGLNSKITGKWIDPLFQKNDSYQIPIVLNPKRDDGKIEVNIEDDLAKARLLMNLLEPRLVNFEENKLPPLSSNAIPKYLKLELNKEKIEVKRIKYKKKTTQENIDLVYQALNLEKNNVIEFFEEAKEYIYYKLLSIAQNYPQYKRFRRYKTWIDNTKVLSTYLKTLKDDKSHITFKFNQAVNYLKYNLYNSKSDNFVIDLSKSIDEIINGSPDPDLRTIDLIPPSFLKTNVYFEHGGDFNSLSSGEKQQIYSINTIAYHLFNLKSVIEYPNIYKYNSVNIIFDEVELYFHPDLQRTYINNLRERILSLDLNGNKDINNINIIFITHSPFILSDIPKPNVLMIEVDKKTKKSLPIENKHESFGSNVHDLLANEFFMENGFMGEFAKKQIIVLSDQLTKSDFITREELEQFEKTIKLIGEPIIRNTLLDLLKQKRNEYDIN